MDSAQSSGRPPNILLIMTDQQRWDSLGCYGASWIRTPNLDRLGSEGVVFDHCYTDNPVCTPARASLMTGKPLPGHGVHRLHDVLPDNEVLFSKRLHDRGYQTALFGKLHVSGRIAEESRRHPNDGFDVYEWCIEAPVGMDSPFNGYSRWLRNKDPDFHDRLKREGRNVLHIPAGLHLTRWGAERTIEFIRRTNRERPFFCKMSLFDPHNPYEQYPMEALDFVDESAIPEPVPPSGHEPIGGIARERDHNYFARAGELGNDGIDAIRRGYGAMIGFVDHEVGRVLRELEAQGIAENTLVVFCSDHGDMLGDHGLMVKGAFFYDPCVRVPLIVRWPAGGLNARSRSSALVQLRDVAATLLSSAGSTPDELHRDLPSSLNLLPLMRGEDKRGRDVVVSLYRNSGICETGRAWDPPIHASMIRDNRYKLTVYHSDATSGDPAPGQLFDLQNDPEERNNLWDAPASLQTKVRLMGLLLEWFHHQQPAAPRQTVDATPAPSQQLVNAARSRAVAEGSDDAQGGV